MNRFTSSLPYGLFALLLPLVVEPACASPSDLEAQQAEEHAATDREPLLAGSKLLWPMKDGKATIHVCFLPIDMGGLAFPLAQYAPNLATVIPERKAWIRQGVEAEWNARTVVQFVGWEDCAPGSQADIQIALISSQGTAQCGSTAPATKGTYCVEEIGSRGRGKRVFINTTWGDEVIYSARYAQTVNQKTYDVTKDVPASWIPAICFNEANAALQFGASNAAIDAFRNVHRACMLNTTVHEFGHLAGFSHEQNRKDVEAACAKRYPATEPDAPDDVDQPLGPFDVESIMSYCRANVAPTLTNQDVAQANAVYAALAPKTTTTGGEDAGVVVGDAGAQPQSESDTPAVTTTPKKKLVTTRTPGGGCNGGGGT